MKELFTILANVRNNEQLLIRFRKGTKVKKILDKQDKKLIGVYFERLRKKHNPWI